MKNADIMKDLTDIEKEITRDMMTAYQALVRLLALAQRVRTIRNEEKRKEAYKWWNNVLDEGIGLTEDPQIPEADKDLIRKTFGSITDTLMDLSSPAPKE